jgi:ectoine hydroxylase-related dioxygenase (phytanoyl-CoA dioxygenase family)
VNQQFEKNGFVLIKNLFKDEELHKIDSIVNKFHQLWIQNNAEFYHTNAINSAYLTSKKYLDEKERMDFFHFIANQKIMDVLYQIIPDTPCFMNTQLFFDPVNKQQKNYWHRDIQYLEISEEEQKTLLLKDNTSVLHFRVPLKIEYGIELVPGTHQRWDTDVEYETRKELNNRKSSDDLPTGETIELNRGDLLVFSAKMIHRGLYGKDRLSLDILYGDNNPELLQFTDKECLPEKKSIKDIKNGNIFLNTLNTIC